MYEFTPTVWAHINYYIIVIYTLKIGTDSSKNLCIDSGNVCTHTNDIINNSTKLMVDINFSVIKYLNT